MNSTRNILGLVFATWAILGVPGICRAGWLVHPCETEEQHLATHESDACGHEHESDSSGCRHESRCAQDPCAEVFAQREESRPFVELFAFALEAPSVFVLPTQREPAADYATRDRTLFHPRLPVPEAALPRLI